MYGLIKIPGLLEKIGFQHEFAVNIWFGIWNNSLVGLFFLPDGLNTVRFTNFLER